MIRSTLLKLAAAAAIATFGGASGGAQTAPSDAVEEPVPEVIESEYQPVDAGPQDASEAPVEQATSASDPAAPPAKSDKVPSGDVFAAAEGVFGKGAEGLGGMIEKLLREQGEPSAYIRGREAGGAFIAGLRYGSGTLHHQVQGERQVHWTGPSIGFDFGADAAKVFVLVYNLDDSQKIFRRYPAAEGNAYVVGGFTASYMRRGDIVLIPVRLGVGARLGVNAGYMRFSEKRRWLPL